MSSFDRDPHRKVSEPTGKDFVRGFADQVAHNTSVGKTSLLVSLAIGFLMGKAGQRRGK